MKRKNGFTLLEILVVISIIGILVGFAATSYSTAQKKARDAARKGQLRSISAALEQYFSICGNVYVTPATVGTNKVWTNITCASPNVTILNPVPADPKGTPYICPGASTCDASGYRLCTTFEADTSSNCTVSQQ